jgi:hypothetical protein
MCRWGRLGAKRDRDQKAAPATVPRCKWDEAVVVWAGSRGNSAERRCRTGRGADGGVHAHSRCLACWRRTRWITGFRATGDRGCMRSGARSTCMAGRCCRWDWRWRGSGLRMGDRQHGCHCVSTAARPRQAHTAVVAHRCVDKSLPTAADGDDHPWALRQSNSPLKLAGHQRNRRFSKLGQQTRFTV